LSHNERLREAIARLEDLNTEIAALARLAKRFPDEPPVGAVIRIFKRHDAPGVMSPGRTIYTYVATRATPKDWFMTGRNYSGRPLSWDELIEFIGDAKVWQASGWARIGEDGDE
jgi:hypothetical protein